jgi:hypothetical protein
MGTLDSFLNYKSNPDFGLLLSLENVMLPEWALLWAIFSQTHLVTLSDHGSDIFATLTRLF